MKNAPNDEVDKVIQNPVDEYEVGACFLDQLVKKSAKKAEITVMSKLQPPLSRLNSLKAVVLGYELPHGMMAMRHNPEMIAATLKYLMETPGNERPYATKLEVIPVINQKKVSNANDGSFN
jgi:galactose-1-phosphate uridylyltransferase